MGPFPKGVRRGLFGLPPISGRQRPSMIPATSDFGAHAPRHLAGADAGCDCAPTGEEAIAMGLIINTNVMALNAQRNLSINTRRLGRALEQLSSGLRINRAADDAAGLAISEKMRTMIRGMPHAACGMRHASRNGQDAISMVQTAEGALNAVHGILQRMRELTVQAGNDTLSGSDRTAIGEEMLTLKTEVDNIASRTTFNGLSLLTGALSVSTTTTIGDITGGGGVVSVAIDVSKASAGTTYAIANTAGAVTITNNTTNVAQTVTAVDMGTASGVQTLTFDALGVKLTLTHDATTNNVNATELGAGLTAGTPIITAAGSGNASFRVGAQSGDNIAVAFDDTRTSAIGSGGSNDIGDLVTDNASVSTIAKSNTLLTSVDDAITDISTTRARLGAAQNQIEAAVDSLGVVSENLSASESRIRDADIAEVSSELVTRQIMQQAGVAVLAQANTSVRSVLMLLQP